MIYILCRQKDLVEVLELNIQVDHVHSFNSAQVFSTNFYGIFERENGIMRKRLVQIKRKIAQFRQK